MGKSIVDIKNMGDALRNTGYKNIESAVSEIIDNSIEANAKNVFVILRENVAVSGRKVVTEIGFLDNGEGMSAEILGGCLGIGASTRQARKGMGRFGVGLPQASLYACPEIEVYSWQNGVQNTKKVYLDINKVKEGIQTELEDPEDVNIPADYAGYIEYNTLTEKFDFSKSGTLVIWKNCDHVYPKTRGPLIEHLGFALGQKFRYFIHNGDCKIRIICHENQEAPVDVAPNDPMFLMEDNLVLCNPATPGKKYKPGEMDGLEPPFELYTAKGTSSGEFEVPIKYINRNGEVTSSNVTIRFSIVKEKIYDKTAFPGGAQAPGASELGKHAARLEGISIIRANREIDFRRFDFYNVTNEPQHRWWGCEVIFMPELDEAFGVANNKQYVELRQADAQEFDPEERDIPTVWEQLAPYIMPTIKAMYAQNEETRKNTRSFEETKSPSTEIINTVENDPANAEFEDEQSDVPAVSEEEAVQAGKEELKDFGFENPTDEQGAAFINNYVNIMYADRGERSPAFDYKVVLKTTVITINTSHKFYTSFLSKIYDSVDVQTTFELFLASLIQSIRNTDQYQQVENERLVTAWYAKLNNYISEQLNPRNMK